MKRRSLKLLQRLQTMFRKKSVLKNRDSTSMFQTTSNRKEMKSLRMKAGSTM
jgi:hypothetical protein